MNFSNFFACSADSQQIPRPGKQERQPATQREALINNERGGRAECRREAVDTEYFAGLNASSPIHTHLSRTTAVFTIVYISKHDNCISIS